MIEIAGYQVTEKIYESRRTEIYRGISEKDNKQVIFKTLKNEYPSQDEVASLNNEYKILNILRNPGIIQAFALEKYNNRPVIIMEDFGGKSIKELLNGKGFDTEEFLQIAIDLAGILGEIHNKDIIHKDINLANILLNPETNQVKIIDFNIATRLSRENLAIVNPDRLEGTLPYISPEQTGRMNRSIDYRSDFYSLGVTFYSMLTGKLPFESDDPMELVHSHIARKAVSPHELDNEIWEVLSDIIMTLMQKNAENRYQTAYGLQDDLDQCYKEFKNNGIIGSFEIGKNDISDKFQIPEKLYGRKEEIEYLISTFNNIANGKKDIILFAGLPGIGKSALIHEVHKPIVEKRGYFLPGKFDKYQKNIPYSGIIQSFKELFKQLLTERKVKMEAWKDDILEAVGNMGKVITDVIDEVEAIIGKQPDVEQLPPEEAQNRFNMVFQSFIKVFAKQEHPLVLFLDDLQWADNPSLQLLQILLTDNELKYFLFIGAYRDNEVDSGHPFMLTLDAIKKEELRWNLVELGPIRENYINRMIADSLYCDSAETTELTELVASKTGGNPFFIKQFLKTLVDDNLVIFVHSQEKTRWTWDIARIQQADITDNVVELVAGKIERLESETWRVMKTACCIGVTFSHELLANCHEKSKADIEEILQSAINEGMIIKIADIMKFAHDRVQEAAYSLISAEDQVQLHYKIGETLLKDPENLNTDAAVFNIADQLNKAKKLLNEEEKKQLIDIDIKAGMISKMSAAYDSSVNFFKNAVELLPANPWQTDYDATFLLYLELSEAEYLATNFEEAEKIFNMILHNAKTILDKSKVYSIKVRFHATQKNRDMALKVGLDAINQLGVPIPSNPGIGGMLLELAKTKLALGKKKPADLINLPEMKDEKMIAAINLMMLCIPVSIAVNPFVTSIFTLKVVALSLKYGITPMAAIAFAVYSSIESSNLGLIRSGIEFGELAKKIADKSGSKYIKSVVYFNNYFTIMHFRIGLKDNIGYMKKVIPTCIEVGNTEYMGLIYSFIPLHYFTSGIPLDVVDREMLQKYKKNIYNLKQPQTTMCYDVNAYCIYTMRGDTDSITALNRNYLEYTDTIIEKYKEANNDMYLASFYVAEVVIQYILNEYDQALDYALKAEVIIDSLFGSPFIQTFNFYYTMVLLVLYPEVGSGKQRKYLKKIKSNRKHFKKLGESNPYNYLNKYYLIEAELHRVTGGDFEKIIQLYDEAITVAKEKEIYHEQAIANELAAKYCLSKEMKSIARGYMTEAFYYFNRWGAKPKADSLQQLYPELISTTGGKQFKISESMSTADSTVSDMNALDLTTIIKASNTISSEIKLRELLMKMMRIVIENAGAQKGFFLLPYKGQWFIEAEGEMNKTDIIVMKSIPAFGQDMENAVPVLPEAIINYVERTKENIVLDNALVEGKFTNDTYIMEKQPKSILCIPLVNQGTLNGILYLENNLTTGAFSEDRVEVLNTLSSQIAISIENARMYKDLDDLNKNLEVKVTDRTKELREKNIQIMNSIKYASTIQYSILPLSETINKYVSGHFALWNPRDVVGGDFYWFHEIGESFFIAVIDCTGHGVPGAFMTMIAKSVLNRIIGESSGKSPATILKDLNSIVRSTLGQDKESALSDDGMDVALCYVEPGENKIIYSGSKLPLYYCENNEVVTIKGDRQSIGYKKSREDFEYTDHEIAVQGDAVFFLSTDGYIDQLGGEKGLPFGRKRFTDTLLEIHQKSFTEVPDIMKKKIKNYRGEEPQIDDITIVGFRV